MKLSRILLICFLSIFEISTAFTCPQGSHEFPDENVCVYVITSPDFYLQAASQCRMLDGWMAKVQNAFENAYLLGMGASALKTNPYIGVERNANGTWVYSDKSPLSYTNWGPNQPNMASNTSVCAAMDLVTGKWMTSECTAARPFFCTTQTTAITTTTKQPSNQPCPDDWVYKQDMGYCYYLRDFAYPDGVHWPMYNWTGAEVLCRQMQSTSHLVSIHSKQEDDFIYDFITSNAADDQWAAPYSQPCEYGRAWIGYKGNGTIGTGSWTDGTPVDYVGHSSQSTVYIWSMINDATCKAKQWEYDSVDGTNSINARFVCKMPAKNSRITKGEQL